MSFTDDMTVKQARDLLRGLAQNGGHDCPVCTQRAQVYTFGFNGAMARGLIRMYRTGGQDWVNVPDLGLPGGHMLKARFWSLIEKPPELVREDGSSRVGVWRLTEDGVGFVSNRVPIRSHARIYNNRCLGFRGDPVMIVQVLGKRFDYHELMNG